MSGTGRILTGIDNGIYIDQRGGKENADMTKQNTSFNVEGKIVLISGAARGIGLACARSLALAGAKIMLADILEALGADAARSICEQGGKAAFCKLDVTSEDDWQRGIAATLETFGGLDVLVNNAGIEIAKPLLQMTVNEWRRMHAINVEGVFLGTKHAITAMISGANAGHGGSIINLSSVAGLVGVPGFAGYCASKGAVRLFSKAVAAEFGAMNIRVNSIHPGVTKTEMGDKAVQDVANLVFGGDFEQGMNFIKNSTPLGRIGETADVVAAVQFLASDAACYITGTELVIDGGISAV